MGLGRPGLAGDLKKKTNFYEKNIYFFSKKKYFIFIIKKK